MQHSKLVVIQSYGSRPEADLAKGALEDAGIQAIIQADTAGGMREHLAWSVQAAESAGCEVLYSEDLSHGQEYGGVLVVNPFLS